MGIKIFFRQLAEIGGWFLENPLLILAVGVVIIGIWAVWEIRKLKD
jgi:ABC-type uncharacterized transport system permease subunit